MPSLRPWDSVKPLQRAKFLVVAHAAPDAGVGLERRQFFERLLQGIPLHGDQVAGDDGKVGPAFVSHRHDALDVFERKIGPGVDIGDLGDPQAVQGSGQIGESELDLAQLELVSSDESAIGGRCKRGRDSRLGQAADHLASRHRSRPGWGGLVRLRQQPARQAEDQCDRIAAEEPERPDRREKVPDVGSPLKAQQFFVPTKQPRATQQHKTEHHADQSRPTPRHVSAPLGSAVQQPKTVGVRG